MAPQDIAAALEVEKNCLYLMSRETVAELANLKVSIVLLRGVVFSARLELQSAYRKRKSATNALSTCIKSRLLH